MLNSKKGFDGSGTVMIIVFVFVSLGVILPFVNSEFNVEGSTFDTENPADELIEADFEDSSSINAGDVFTSVAKMFFWTFGDLPFWIDGIFVVLRIMLLAILIKAFTPFL